MEPFLYSHFTESIPNDKAPQLLLRTLLSRTDLAVRVKSYTGNHYDDHMDLFCFGEQDWPKVKARIEEVSKNAAEAAEWLKCVGAGDWEAITALTLTLTPNIQDLGFEHWNYTNEGYPTLLRVIENPLSLKNVRRVSQGYWDNGGMPIDTIIPLLSLPSVERFSA